ncbi:MAG: transporter [Deltaproteobacteria bacterium]|nr:transporter [Deltaproteobacteria bacterium]
MKKMGSIFKGSLLFLLVVLFSPANIKAEQVGPLVADSADTLEAQKFSFQVIPSLFIKQGGFDQAGKIKYSPGGDRKYQLLTVAKPYYGLFENFEVSAQIPFLSNWVTRDGWSNKDGGIGDILIGGKYRFVENDQQGLRPSIAGIAKIKFPTGKYERMAEGKLGSDQAGNGSYEYTLGLNISKLWGTWSLHGNLWYNWVAETTIDGLKTKPGDIIYYDLAVEYSLTKKLTALIELNGWEQGRTGQNNRILEKSETRSLSLLPALEWEWSEKVFFIFGCSIPLLGKNTDYGFTPSFMLNYNF